MNSATKRILITAKNSYIGNSFAAWVSNDPNYNIEFISCKDGGWKNKPFSNYDVVVHVAGIAHVEAKANMKSLYYKINRDLTIELARKAKEDGVQQFIFLSSMIVFGESNPKRPSIIIKKTTLPNPDSFYGKSKLEAEESIYSMSSRSFKVTIIRPPMVYGIGSKGNFPKLLSLSKRVFIFPDIDNRRSVIYIDNLCEMIRLLIKNKEEGFFHPQNDNHISTTYLVKKMNGYFGKNVKLTKVFNPIINCLRVLKVTNKLFGSFYYEKEMTKYSEKYTVVGTDESLQNIVKNFKDNVKVGMENETNRK